MITSNGKDFKIYYLDTCVLSQLVKDRAGFGSKLINLIYNDGIIGVSAHSIWELKSAPSIYAEVLNLITALPCFLLKSDDMLFEEEYNNFNLSENSTISPTINHLLKKEYQKQGIDIIDIIHQHVTNDKNVSFITERNETFRILASKPSNIYSREELTSADIINRSVVLGATLLAATYKRDEMLCHIESTKTAFPIEKFLSLMSVSYMAHYKYLQPNRPGSQSDVVDISMASLYPYVDSVITESHQCEMINQIKKRHGFLNNLQPISIRQINSMN